MGVKKCQECQIKAVEIGVNLSSYLISVCIALIGIIAASVSFLTENIGDRKYIIALSAGASIMFMVSIWFGGKGINVARTSVFEGIMDLSQSRAYFNRQAITALLGFVLYVTAVFITASDPRKDRSSEKQILSQIVATLHGQAAINEKIQKEIELLHARSKVNPEGRKQKK